jgi:hypothetical protein
VRSQWPRKEMAPQVGLEPTTLQLTNPTLANGRIGCANESQTSNYAGKNGTQNAKHALRSTLFGDSRRTREPRPADAGWDSV